MCWTFRQKNSNSFLNFDIQNRYYYYGYNIWLLLNYLISLYNYIKIQMNTPTLHESGIFPLVFFILLLFLSFMYLLKMFFVSFSHFIFVVYNEHLLHCSCILYVDVDYANAFKKTKKNTYSWNSVNRVRNTCIINLKIYVCIILCNILGIY